MRFFVTHLRLRLSKFSTECFCSDAAETGGHARPTGTRSKTAPDDVLSLSYSWCSHKKKDRIPFRLVFTNAAQEVSYTGPWSSNTFAVACCERSDGTPRRPGSDPAPTNWACRDWACAIQSPCLGVPWGRRRPG